MLSTITGDDGASSGDDDGAASFAAPLDYSAGAGLWINSATDTANDSVATLGPVQDKNSAPDPIATLGPVQDKNPAIDPGPTLGPVEDNNSAWNENLAGTSGAGSLTAYLGPTTLDGAPAGSRGNVSPASSDNSFHFGALGVGTLDDLMSGAGVMGPSGFGAGSVLAGAGIESGGNGLAGAGINGFFTALTGAYSPPAGQSQDLAAGSLNLDSQLSQLVQAMATYSASGAGFASSPFTQVSNDSGLLGAIAAAGHG
jgi:hypothetical protein